MITCTRGQRNLENPVLVIRLVRSAESTVDLARRLHERGHLGQRALLWDLLFNYKRNEPNFRAIVKDTIASCEACQQLKCSIPLYHPLSSHIGDGPWSSIQFDLIMSLPETPRGNKYLLVVYCTYSKYLVLSPLANKEAQTVAAAMLGIFATYRHASRSSVRLGH